MSDKDEEIKKLKAVLKMKDDRLELCRKMFNLYYDYYALTGLLVTYYGQFGADDREKRFKIDSRMQGYLKEQEGIQDFTNFKDEYKQPEWERNYFYLPVTREGRDSIHEIYIPFAKVESINKFTNDDNLTINLVDDYWSCSVKCIPGQLEAYLKWVDVK